MTPPNRLRTIALAFATLALSDLALVPACEAVVGAPLTPMSYAGVARRTTRRAAYAGAATANANAAAAANANAAAANANAAAANAAAAQAAAPQIVASLPPGCNASGEYFICGSQVYKPIMSGSTVVYQFVGTAQ